MTPRPTQRAHRTPACAPGPGPVTRGILLGVLWLATACAQRPVEPNLPLATLLPADALLLGEQHDAPDHQDLAYQSVQVLQAQPGLAALVLEMAEAGHSTQGLPRQASPEQVRTALQWSQTVWPWATYEAVVMAAVRAGVPVLGGNLPRAELRQAMQDAGLDALLPESAWQAQQDAIRIGHCDLLPPSQWRPMARVQVARDRAMARVLASAVQPGRAVLLLAGRGHVDRELGIPRHLPPGLRVRSVALGEAGTTLARFDAVWPARPAPATDHCAQLRAQWSSVPPTPAPSAPPSGRP